LFQPMDEFNDFCNASGFSKDIVYYFQVWQMCIIIFWIHIIFSDSGPASELMDLDV
jgi:hypothetical protein